MSAALDGTVSRRGPIFVLDDDPAIRGWLTRLLAAAGLVVESFATGSDLVAAARQREPACVISDVVMPDMDGFAMHALLAEVSPGSPVIFVTGYDSVPLRQRADECGAAGYLRKPIERDALLEAVRKALEARGTTKG